MKNKVWEVNVFGQRGFSAVNDVIIGSNDEENDVVLHLGDGEISGKTLQKGVSVLEGGKDLNAYTSIKQISADNKYLFELAYDYIDYDFANKYFEENKSLNSEGRCSSLRKGKLYGRNLDWTYSEDADFVIKVSTVADRHASIGVGYKSGLTADMARNREYSDDYKLLPFMVVDGINDCGVFVNSNVVPANDNPHPTTLIGAEGKPSISCKMVPRWVLDHYASADDAIRGLQEDVQIYNYNGFMVNGYEPHWMIGDGEKTYIVEMWNNQIVVTEYGTDYDEETQSCPAMFNFYRYGVINYADGKLTAPVDVTEETAEEDLPSNKHGLGLHASGVERNNLVADHYDELTSAEAMLGFMNGKVVNGEPAGLAYTNAYRSELDNNDFWYSEFCGSPHNCLDVHGNIVMPDDPSVAGYDFEMDINTPQSVFETSTTIAFAQENEARRERSGMVFPTWQTVHTSVYDIEECKLYLISQEGDLDDDKVYEFGLTEEVQPSGSSLQQFTCSAASLPSDFYNKIKNIKGNYCISHEGGDSWVYNIVTASYDKIWVVNSVNGAIEQYVPQDTDTFVYWNDVELF